MKQRIYAVFALLLAVLLSLAAACSGAQASEEEDRNAQTQAAVNEDEDEDDDDDAITTSANIAMTISTDGTHSITGNIDGQILVTAEKATLLLDNAVVTSTSGPAILGDDGDGGDSDQVLTLKLSGNSSLSSADSHGVQAKDYLTVTGEGSVSIAAAKDGLHAGNGIELASGTVEVTDSYEGMEAPQIILSGATVTAHASDDGVNAATDEQGEAPSITMSSGTLTIFSGSDGIDSNGTLTITGGTCAVFIYAPRDGQTLDCNSAPSVTPAISVTASIPKGAAVAVKDASGKAVWEGEALYEATAFCLIAPAISEGGAYTVSANGSDLASANATSSVAAGMGGMGGKGGGTMGGLKIVAGNNGTGKARSRDGTQPAQVPAN